MTTEQTQFPLITDNERRKKVVAAEFRKWYGEAKASLHQIVDSAEQMVANAKANPDGILADVIEVKPLNDVASMLCDALAQFGGLALPADETLPDVIAVLDAD
jgi:hypothetical protein